jgi:hypothetical protein
MKFTFETQNADKDFTKFAKGPVLVDGMKLIEMCYVKVKDSDIDIKHYNFGRVEGKTDSPHIKKLRTIFRNDEYEPQFHEPPVITKKGKLASGKHRFISAKLEKVEYIWVAICTFATTKSLRQYAITENLRKDPKNEADQSAVVYNVISAIQSGDCNKNAHAVRQYLKEIDWNIQIEKTVDMVLSSVIEDYKQTTNPTRDEIVQAVKDEFGVDVTQATQWLVSTMRGGTGEVAGDRHARLWSKVWHLLIKGLDVNVAVSFSNTLAKDIPESRVNIVENYLPDYIDQCVKVAEAYKSGNLGDINFLFKTQTEGEDGNFIKIDS